MWRSQGLSRDRFITETSGRRWQGVMVSTSMSQEWATNCGYGYHWDVEQEGQIAGRTEDTLRYWPTVVAPTSPKALISIGIGAPQSLEEWRNNWYVFKTINQRSRNGGFLKWGYPQIIQIRSFYYWSIYWKPMVLGSPIVRKPPSMCIKTTCWYHAVLVTMFISPALSLNAHVSWWKILLQTKFRLDSLTFCHGKWPMPVPSGSD